MSSSSLSRSVIAVFGGALLLTGLTPIPTLLLAPGRTGLAGAATRGMVQAFWPSVVLGTAVVAVLAWILVRSGVAGRLVDRIPTPPAGPLGGPRPGRQRWVWVLACGCVALVGTMAVHHLVLRGHPTLLDEMVQLADARNFPDALELPVDPAFRVLQHGRVVGSATGASVDGWVSMYPPGHTAVLEARLALGHLPIAVLWGATVALATLLFLMVLPPAPGALAGVLLALSPWGWLVGASAMSHVTAAFGVVLALTAALASARAGAWAEARSGAQSRRLRYVAPAAAAAVVGVGAGIAVTARPLTGLALAVLLPVGVWIVAASRRAGGDGWWGFAVRVASATLAGLPFLVGWLSVQTTRFGAPLRTGYEATFGPAVRPGWRVDPWGNVYDLPAAVGATAADVFLAGIAALETPLPIGVAIGAGLVALAVFGARREARPEAPTPAPPDPAGPDPRPGLWIFGGWIVVALAANATYWHHGYHLGPRMLFETLPAWIGLAVWVGWRLTAIGPSARDWVAAISVCMALGAVAFGVPTRLSTAIVDADLAAQLEIAPPPPDAGIVFVHGSSARRAVAKLQALGMRADSIESAVRRNDLCDVDAWANAHRAGRPSDAPRLDFERWPGAPDDIVRVQTGPGITARVRVGASGQPEIGAGCMASVVRPDAAGTLELDVLLWRLEDEQFAGGDVLWVRDLGPTDNAALRTAFPDRAAYVVTPGTDGRARYEPYAEAMSRIWTSDGVDPN